MRLLLNLENGRSYARNVRALHCVLQAANFGFPVKFCQASRDLCTDRSCNLTHSAIAPINQAGYNLGNTQQSRVFYSCTDRKP